MSYVIPYICPRCDHDYWLRIRGLPGGQRTRCPECGDVSVVRGPDR